jgi:uncharacterized protein YigA (DUF484 family)
MESHIREKIISDPEVLLEDQDIMRALVAANEQSHGTNIVDLRGVAMERLAARLDRLEDTHRSVIAAAYDNLAGTNQVHRAVLRLLDATKFEVFLNDLSGEVADTLRVDVVRLILETDSEESEPAVSKMENVLSVKGRDFVDNYITRGRDIPVRSITLRQTRKDGETIFGEKSDYIRSEACLKLNFGEGRLPGMLLLGSEDPHLFTPQQGTDLMTFFGGVFERAMRRWLD